MPRSPIGIRSARPLLVAVNVSNFTSVGDRSCGSPARIHGYVVASIARPVHFHRNTHATGVDTMSGRGVFLDVQQVRQGRATPGARPERTHGDMRVRTRVNARRTRTPI